MSENIFVIDLDGTLFDDDNRISEKNQGIIQEILSHDDFFIIATGRRLEAIQEVFHSLNSLKYERIYYICSDGHEIYNHKFDLIFKSEFFKNDQIDEIVTNIMKCKSIEFYSDSMDYLFLQDMIKMILMKIKYNTKKYLKGMKPICVDQIRDIYKYDWDNMEIDKIRVNGEFRVDNIRKSDVTIFLNYYEIVCADINKFTALRRIASLLSLNLEHACAIGNDANDICLAKNIKYFYAVENATPKLVNYTKYMTKSNINDGVYYAILDYLKRREIDELYKNDNL